MSIRTVLIILLAVICGGSLALGAMVMLQEIKALQRQVQAQGPAETVTVVVAAEDVAPNQALSPEMLLVQDYPKDKVPPGSMQRKEDAVGRRTLASIPKGWPIAIVKLGSGIATNLPRGMRAFTINAPSIASHSALIQPGSTVDVLRADRSGGTDDANTILQNIKVFAVDERVEAVSSGKADHKEARSVTLQVTPEQAQALAHAQTGGSLHLTLRNPEDTAELKLAKPLPPPEKKEEKKELQPVDSIRQALYHLAPPSPPVVRTLRGNYPGEVELR
jgi:pilus assembly protein CpaB